MITLTDIQNLSGELTDDEISRDLKITRMAEEMTSLLKKEIKALEGKPAGEYNITVRIFVR